MKCCDAILPKCKRAAFFFQQKYGSITCHIDRVQLLTQSMNLGSQAQGVHSRACLQTHQGRAPAGPSLDSDRLEGKATLQGRASYVGSSAEDERMLSAVKYQLVSLRSRLKQQPLFCCALRLRFPHFTVDPFPRSAAIGDWQWQGGATGFDEHLSRVVALRTLASSTQGNSSSACAIKCWEAYGRAYRHCVNKVLT
eukprot:1158013-Pelagomonas_calceolata.AAC.3